MYLALFSQHGYTCFVVQIYLFTEVYLLLAASILLSERYGTDILILFNLKALFDSKPGFRIAGIISGFVILAGLCFVPMSPGPAFLGDLLPSLCVISVLYKLVLNKGGIKTGYFALVCAAIHMVAPSIVIL